MEKPTYDTRKQAKVSGGATLRIVLAAYLAYLGWQILTAGEDGMPPLAARLIGGAFIVAALAFGFYVWRRWRLDLEAARLPEDARTQEEGDEQP